MLWLLLFGSSLADLNLINGECPKKPNPTDICFCLGLIPTKSGLSLSAGGTPSFTLAFIIDSWLTNVSYGPMTLNSPTFSYLQCGNSEPDIWVDEHNKSTVNGKICSYHVEVSTNYLANCNFTIREYPDKYYMCGDLLARGGVTQTFLSETYMQEFERTIPFCVIIPKRLEVEANITVARGDYCHNDTDCNDQPCHPVPPYPQKVCNCDQCHTGLNCEHDLCPPDIQCPADLTINACKYENGVFKLADGTPVVIPQTTVRATDVSGHVGTKYIELIWQLQINGNSVGILPSPLQVADDGSGGAILTTGAYPYPSGPSTTATVRYNVFDKDGHRDFCEYTVSLRDICDPTINCPIPMVTNSITAAQATLSNFPLTAQDFGYPNNPALTVTMTPAGFTFSTATEGLHLFTFCVDDHVNPPVCCNTTILLDLTPPNIAMTNIRIPTKDYENYSNPTPIPPPTVSDPNCPACSGIDTVTCIPPLATLNKTWPNTRDKAREEVCCNATDHAGNSASACAKVTVYDPLDPKITCHPVEVETDPGKDYAIWNFNPQNTLFTWEDNDEVASAITVRLDGQLINVPGTYQLNPPDGPVYTFSITVTDVSGNDATLTCTLRVVDKEKPKLLPPDNSTEFKPMDDSKNCYDALQNILNKLSLITDNSGFHITSVVVNGQTVDVNLVNNTWMCGEGPNKVVITSCDAANNCKNSTVTIIVYDKENPKVRCPFHDSQPEPYQLRISEDYYGKGCGTPNNVSASWYPVWANSPPVVTDNYGLPSPLILEWPTYMSSPANQCFPVNFVNGSYTGGGFFSKHIVLIRVHDIAQQIVPPEYNHIPPNWGECPFEIVVTTKARNEVTPCEINIKLPNLIHEADWDKNTYNFPPNRVVECEETGDCVHNAQHRRNCNFTCVLQANPYRVLYQEDAGQPCHNYTCCTNSSEGEQACKTSKICTTSNQPPRVTASNITVDLACDQGGWTFHFTRNNFSFFDNDGENPPLYPIDVSIVPPVTTLTCSNAVGVVSQTATVTVTEREQYPGKPRLSASKTFTMTIRDTCPPDVHCPPLPITLLLTCPCGDPDTCDEEIEWDKTALTIPSSSHADYLAIVNSLTVYDKCGVKQQINLPTFPLVLHLGVNNLTFYFVDAAGNVGSATCPVKVIDKIPPHIPTVTPSIAPSASRSPNGPSDSPSRSPNGPPESPSRSPNGPPESPSRSPNGPPESPSKSPNGQPESPSKSPNGPSPSKSPNGQPESPSKSPNGPSPSRSPNGPPESPSKSPNGPPESPSKSPNGPPESPSKSPNGPGQSSPSGSVTSSRTPSASPIPYGCPLDMTVRSSEVGPGFVYYLPPIPWEDNVAVANINVTIDGVLFCGPCSPAQLAVPIPLIPGKKIKICTTAMDVNGNPSIIPCCWDVKLNDDVPPDLECLEDTQLEATGTGINGQPVVYYSFVYYVNDDYTAPQNLNYVLKVDNVIVRTGHPDSNGVINITNLGLLYNNNVLPQVVHLDLVISDEAGNKANCPWDVIIKDTTPGHLDCGEIPFTVIYLRPPAGSNQVVVDYPDDLEDFTFDSHDHDVTIAAFYPPPGTILTYNGGNTVIAILTLLDDRTIPNLYVNKTCFVFEVNFDVQPTEQGVTIVFKTGVKFGYTASLIPPATPSITGDPT
eukprot:g3313.t1